MKRFHGKRAPVVHMSERPGQAEMGKDATRVGEGTKKHPPGNFRSHCIEPICKLFFTCSIIYIYIYILFNHGSSSNDFLLNVFSWRYCGGFSKREIYVQKALLL